MDQAVRRIGAHKLADLLVDQRVSISLLVFSALVLQNVAFGHKPHAIFEFADPHVPIGLCLVLVGLGIRSWAAGVLQKGQALTTNGPYALCRNPLYLGSLMMMLGFCAILDDPKNVVVVIGLVAIVYFLTIRREEIRLTGKYAAAWKDYAAAVPRLIPYRFPRRLALDWSLRQWLKNHEYRAVAASLVGLGAIELWRQVG